MFFKSEKNNVPIVIVHNFNENAPFHGAKS